LVLPGASPPLFPVNPVLAAAPAATVSAPAFEHRPAHPYAAHVSEAAQRFGLPEAWIWAVMRAESNGNPAATSHVGAMGLMQIMPGTWSMLTARYGLGSNPWDVRANILAGAAYLREMMIRYGDLSLALAAYNAGPGRVDDWRQHGRTLPAETTAYVARIPPVLSMSGIASPAAVPVPARSAAPSWRETALFVVQDDGLSGDGSGAAGRTGATASSALAAQSGGLPDAQTPRSSTVPTSAYPQRSHDLFVALSGGSER